MMNLRLKAIKFNTDFRKNEFRHGGVESLLSLCFELFLRFAQHTR